MDTSQHIYTYCEHRMQQSCIEHVSLDARVYASVTFLLDPILDLGGETEYVELDKTVEEITGE